jgi:hypothetical protein
MGSAASSFGPTTCISTSPEWTHFEPADVRVSSKNVPESLGAGDPSGMVAPTGE